MIISNALAFHVSLYVMYKVNICIFPHGLINACTAVDNLYYILFSLLGSGQNITHS